MKRTPLLNRDLSALVASLGHLDEIVVADAGLPIPAGVAVIDLAVTADVPSIWDVLQALATELVIESAVTAKEASRGLRDDFDAVFRAWGHETDKEIARGSVTHEAFKERTRRARAVVRTGQCTPYANVILVSGVPF